MNISHMIKEEFPIFTHNPDLVYLDSTATSLKPRSVLQKLNEYYQHYSSNIFRGVYDISEKATSEYEETREKVAKFIHAFDTREVIFTSGTTESINMFMSGISHTLQSGEEIAVSIAEHHSNFVPWQVLSKKKGLVFRVISEDRSQTVNQFNIDNLQKYINSKTKILAITHVSNVLGTINPIKNIISEVKKINPHCIVLVDGAQAIPHMNINVQDLGCDAFVFSGHKMLGPTGVGVLWVKKALLERLEPYQYGGEMIRKVGIDNTEFADIPHKFEAGTPHIAGVIALKESISFLYRIGLESIARHEVELAQYCFDQLNHEFGEGITIVGPHKRQSGIVAFEMNSIHAHDVAQVLNEDHIAVRAGHHCAMPLHTHLGIDATVRASFYLYNTHSDVDKLVSSLKKVQKIFST